MTLQAFSLVATGGVWRLQIAHQGDRHAQLADLNLIDRTGRRHAIGEGLAGYVLPGQQRSWPLPQRLHPTSLDTGAIDVRVNGERLERALHLPGADAPAAPVTAAYQGQTLDMPCRNGTAWVLSLDNGQHFDGSSRRMRMGTSTDYVRYGLYRNSGRTIGWASLAGTGTGSSQTTVVYGQVAAGQSVPAGDYQDVVRVTVTY